MFYEIPEYKVYAADADYNAVLRTYTGEAKSTEQGVSVIASERRDGGKAVARVIRYVGFWETKKFYADNWIEAYFMGIECRDRILSK